MSNTEDIKKEIEELRVKINSNRVSDDEKQFYRDKIKELSLQIKSNMGIEKKVVPVETNSVIADRVNQPKSRFINSSAYKI